MRTSKINKGIQFEGSACYRIVVQGELSERWIKCLGTMEKSSAGRRHGLVCTTLRGLVRDQAQLNGILDTLYSLHLPILEIEKTEEETPDDNP
jgi:hypothetical protein